MDNVFGWQCPSPEGEFIGIANSMSIRTLHFLFHRAHFNNLIGSFYLAKLLKQFLNKL